ncbi:MAG: 3'(2'),5'-bisphosphate nucleotidase CysQ [Gammaproteobacteria bacterium]|nr:3'(2'),5'-bisphosphate nucleotidase CysQ [Gammaproteobacteria bacterium]
MNLDDALIDLARRAGDAIMQVYAGEFEVRRKADASPVTIADLRAHDIIVAGLRRLTPDLPIISEESEPADFEVRRTWDRYWLVDPLDGTREFVNRNGDFTVNIALIDANRPVTGVVGVPVREEVFFGDVISGVAHKITRDGRQALRTRAVSPAHGLTVVASRSHGSGRLERYLDTLRVAFGRVARQSVGSSLKFCMLAEGLADFYPRLGPTSEWDTGAAQAVLTAAGGAVLRFDGSELAYNTKPSFLNPDFFCVGDPAFPWIERLPPA